MSNRVVGWEGYAGLALGSRLSQGLGVFWTLRGSGGDLVVLGWSRDTVIVGLLIVGLDGRLGGWSCMVYRVDRGWQIQVE